MAAHRPFDLLIGNGRIVDGSGNVWYRADLGVRGDTIAAIGDLEGTPAARVLDARGMVVCPGFIDPHTHAGIALLATPRLEPTVRQGVTTVLVGLCGNSPAPLTDRSADSVRRYLLGCYGHPEIAWEWRSVADYLARLDGAVGINVATLMGVTNLWVDAVGWEARRASAEELAHMRDLAAQAMEDGAAGLSIGAYAPSEWSSHDQVVDIAKVVAKHGGIYFCHIRHPSEDDPLSGFKEGISVAEEAGIPVHLLHFKVFPETTHHKSGQMLALVDAARKGGCDVTVESYPYLAGSGTSFPPTWAHEGGPDAMLARMRDPQARARIVSELNQVPPEEWGRRTIAGAQLESYSWCVGKPVEQAASEAGKSLGEFLVDLMLDNELVAQHVSHGGCEDDVRNIMTHPAHMVASDSLYFGEKLHPRTYGCHARYLGRYVRELGVLMLEQCIRMMTSLPAQRLCLLDRGLLRPGFKADITIFDPDVVIDKSTFEEPLQYAEGIEHVVVNGVPVIVAGKHTGELPGRSLTPQR